jgi:hypothetical protein
MRKRSLVKETGILFSIMLLALSKAITTGRRRNNISKDF